MEKQRGPACRQAGQAPVPYGTGQAILALILIMAVALAIGVSVIQKSLFDVSTATKVEESQRAFSAAEAGIERALRGDSSGVSLSETGNQSAAEVSGGALIPCVPGSSGCAQASGQQQQALEYSPLSKEEFAHVWLVDPTSLANPPPEVYMPASKATGRGIEIYWGNPSAERAAIAVKIIYHDGTSYQTRAYYFDSDGTRALNNGFTNASGNCSSPTTDTILGMSTFFCKRIIDPSSSPPFPPSGLMLVRIRLLYSSTSQPVAVRGLGQCGASCSLPPQARLVTSTGESGETERKLQVLLIDKVVPPYFDFAIFSAGEIRK